MAKLKKIKSKSEGNAGRKGSAMDKPVGYATRTFMGLG
jgi:hypothetical protein